VFYPLTSKLDTPAQLAKHERRRHILCRVTEAGGISFSNNQSPADAPPSLFSGMHHHFASHKGSPINLFQFLQEHDGDPAIKVEMILQWGCLTLFSQWLTEFHAETEGPCSLPAAESRYQLLQSHIHR